ncbi:MAG: molybdenum cofactor guanylyltransferase [Deltaproteobacteria bacterium]|jgi:molybdopterin-guanine dinucleotide biosynthesis protein A|nr:molybdenum cofactor guanylyltransferase [Deltaproteobacteria bacterium]
MTSKSKFLCTGVILSGGLAHRYDGTEKALLRVGGERILDRLYGIYRQLFDEIILVTNNPEKFLEWDLLIVSDLFPIRSSLTGIHAGLFYMSNPYGFFSACDTPFLKKEMIETVITKIEAQIDIVMPETSDGFEPLCAVYSKRCFEAAQNHLERKKLKITKTFRKSRIKTISEKALRKIDPELRSFFNINTPEDLVRAEEMVNSLNG